MNEKLSETESLDRTKRLLLKWKNDKNIQKLKEFYDTKSFSAILGVERREMSHSNFIAWILNDTESHNLGQFAIKQLFDMLLEYGEDKIKHSLESYNNINGKNLEFNNLYKALMLNSYIIEDLKIGVEQSFKGGRIDIIVSMSFKNKNDDIELPEKVNIIIENKVDSSEHSNQTKKYYNYYTTNEEYKDDLNLFVFLLPISTSRLKEKLSDSEYFININYQLLADNIFERALHHDISDRVKFIINEYLLSLRKPSKKGVIMATGTLEKELLKEFWETHQELLMPIFPIIADLEEDPEKSKGLKEVAETMNKNFTRYNSLDNYIDAKLNNHQESITRLRILMNKIESIFKGIDKIKITYAPTSITISNEQSKIRRKNFVYIETQKSKIKFIIKNDNDSIIYLLSEDEIKNEKDNYINLLKEACESLEK